MNRRCAAGFTLIELLIVVAIIGIVAAIAIPGLLHARMAGNEASAIGSLHAVNSGQVAYASACGGGGYATTLADLFKAPASGTGFISPDLALDPSLKSGFLVTLAPIPGAKVVVAAAQTCNSSAADAQSTFFAAADPVAFNSTGTRHFGTDSRGTIYQNTSDTPLTPMTLATTGTVTTVQ